MQPMEMRYVAIRETFARLIMISNADVLPRFTSDSPIVVNVVRKMAFAGTSKRWLTVLSHSL